MVAWSIAFNEGFFQHCLGDGRVFENFFLGVLPWVFGSIALGFSNWWNGIREHCQVLLSTVSI